MIKRFTIKFIIFTLPFSLVVLSYFVFDPFKVLYHYDSFYKDFFASVNRDYASSRMFMQNYGTYHYDSFIFGSSRTLGFSIRDWRTHLESSAKPYKFDAFSETLKGIHTKVRFLDKKNVHIENALVIICPDVTFDKQQSHKTAQKLKDPEIEGEFRYLSFQQSFLSSYLHDYFFFDYMKSKWRYAEGQTAGLEELQVDPVSNDLTVLYWEKELAASTSAFYKKRDSVFYKRKGVAERLPPAIDENMRLQLEDIKSIFDKQNTNYEIVISPLYDQKTMSVEDENILVAVFGQSRVHNFSGINDITRNKFNYYENSHFRPNVGKRIMNEVYSDF